MSGLSYLEKLLDGVGVEWKRLGDVADIGTGSSNRQDENEKGIYPFYVRSKNVLRSDTFQFDETAIVIPGEGGIGDIFHYVEGKYSLHQRAYRICIKLSGLNTKFIYYFMSSGFKKYILMKKVGATSISIRKPMLEDFQIPIPCPDNPEKSLAIQSEIVRILDTFTALTNELTNELKLRRQQYNYYREQLLSFKEGEVEWKRLGEIAEYSKTRISFEQLDETNYVGVDNLLQNCEGKTQSNYVPKSGNFTEFREKDILIGNIRPYLRKIWQADCAGGTNGDVLVIRCNNNSISVRYLYQVLADGNFFEYNMKYAKGAKMPRGNKEAILKYRIPIPPFNEQIRIITILDKFDTLTNSISEGLPLEIELRKKQYEYYRDLLYSFPKPVSADN
ncbi:restriction endonuclease subunit S [Salmonella enterica]|nr:restriction endonuclease subunit S [Salmonella enterica]EEP2129550.1 restriction endonuclease subunit S [Salmonella enterica]EGZ5754717.1 restriction endonuclease subunit S [Salmonella enterica]EIF7653776.1 restriction endonuclease subunit S [Salmonella enterica]EMD4557318.1 restriction endonuclease subunit S [Salmonella enterica]